MTRKTKTLIIAIGAVLLLGGGYYGASVWQKNKGAAGVTPYTPPARLGNLESFDLVKIEAGGLVLEKTDGVWELTHTEDGKPASGIELDQREIQYLTYTLATVWTDRLIDDEPEDVSVYGLDSGSSRTTVTDSSGRRAEYIVGDITPSLMSYYIREEGNPAVYTISAYTARALSFTLDDLRQRDLIPAMNPATLIQLQLGQGANRIEIMPRHENLPPYLSFIFSSHYLSSPYQLPRAVSGEALNNLMTNFSNLTIEDFIDDNPSSLVPYGLDRPFEFSLRAMEGSFDLLIGNPIDGKHYAKLANKSGVFTVRDMEELINTKPISLIDKFVILVNIDSVEHMMVKGDGRTIIADLFEDGYEGLFYLDGRKAESVSFRKFYESVIGLLVDAEYPANSPEQTGDDSANITIALNLSNPPGVQVSITLIPYNRDFYIVRQDGTTEFLISRSQVRRIFTSADAVILE